MSSEDTQFKPGQSGNPKGREKGSRNKLGEAWLKAMSDDFSKYGMESIERLRKDNPAMYNSLIVKLMPKLMELSGPDEGPLSLVVEFIGVKEDE